MNKYFKCAYSQGYGFAFTLGYWLLLRWSKDICPQRRRRSTARAFRTIHHHAIYRRAIHHRYAICYRTNLCPSGAAANSQG